MLLTATSLSVNGDWRANLLLEHPSPSLTV